MTTFLKLGGSVITEKAHRNTPRLETIKRLAGEIARARNDNPGMRLVLGHGSGSFGHSAAAVHATHLGARSAQDWSGFAAVWRAARQLNSLILDALSSEGIPAISFPPSATSQSIDGEITSMLVEPVLQALAAGLVPVVYGDVIFDRTQGATIASTEQVFAFLAEPLVPTRVLIAGREAGVYAALGEEMQPLPEINPVNRQELTFSTPEGEDVTGGMAAKVDFCLAIARLLPDGEVLIFSAEQPELLYRVLSGEAAGTRIRA